MMGAHGGSRRFILFENLDLDGFEDDVTQKYTLCSSQVPRQLETRHTRWFGLRFLLTDIFLRKIFWILDDSYIRDDWSQIDGWWLFDIEFEYKYLPCVPRNTLKFRISLQHYNTE